MKIDDITEVGIYVIQHKSGQLDLAKVVYDRHLDCLVAGCFLFGMYYVLCKPYKHDLKVVAGPIDLQVILRKVANAPI